MTAIIPNTVSPTYVIITGALDTVQLEQQFHEYEYSNRPWQSVDIDNIAKYYNCTGIAHGFYIGDVCVTEWSDAFTILRLCDIEQLVVFQTRENIILIDALAAMLITKIPDQLVYSRIKWLWENASKKTWSDRYSDSDFKLSEKFLIRMEAPMHMLDLATKKQSMNTNEHNSLVKDIDYVKRTIQKIWDEHVTRAFG